LSAQLPHWQFAWQLFCAQASQPLPEVVPGEQTPWPLQLPHEPQLPQLQLASQARLLVWLPQ
jgi:hypothetical protein